MKYLRVCIEHFDSLSGDEEVHLRHGLSFTFWSLKIENHTISVTERESDRMKERQRERESWQGPEMPWRSVKVTLHLASSTFGQMFKLFYTLLHCVTLITCVFRLKPASIASWHGVSLVSLVLHLKSFSFKWVREREREKLREFSTKCRTDRIKKIKRRAKHAVPDKHLEKQSQTQHSTSERTKYRIQRRWK